MLATFRAMAKSKITLVVLFVPLGLGLLVFGNVRDVFSNMAAKDSVVSAGDRSVTSAQFKRIFDGAKGEYEKRSGTRITNEEAAAKGGIDQILESLAGREGFLAALTKAGVRPSDKLIADQFRKIPAFFDPVTGQFDEKLYRQKLAEQGMTVEGFEKDQKDDIAQSHFSAALANGLRTPAVYSAIFGAMAGEQRTFSAFAIDPNSVPMPPAPTDAQLNAFIKAHAADMTKPEVRTLTVVRFSARALEPGIAVDPADLQKRYDFRKDTLSTPEKRSIVQIPANSQAEAVAAAARLAKGEDPVVVARAIGKEPVGYPDAPKTAIADKGIADAAFGLAAGQVAPAQGTLGWAAIKVVSITPGKVTSLADARPQLEAELRAEAAQDKVYDIVEKYQTAHEGGANLAESSRAAGVSALQLPPVSAQGANEQGQPQPILSPKLLTQAFMLPEGGESEVVDDGKGEYFAVRVDKVFPAALASIANERDKITTFYMRSEQLRLLQAKVDLLLARVRKGETMDAVAASVGAKVDRMTLDRRTAEQDQTQRRAIFAGIFAAKPNEVFNASSVILHLEAIKPGPVQQAAVLTKLGQRELTLAALKDIGDQAFKWTRKEEKVKLDVNRARAALDLPPIQKDAAGTILPAKAPEKTLAK